MFVVKSPPVTQHKQTYTINSASMMSLTNQKFVSSSFTLLHNPHHNLHSFNPPHHFVSRKNNHKSLHLLATASTNPLPLSPSNIFLPFLQNDEEQNPQTEHETSPENQTQLDSVDEPKDPILNFFKSRTSTKDPVRESKITLQKNRRSSWHLAPTGAGGFSDSEESDGDIQIESENEKSVVAVDDASNSRNVVSEILGISRGLRENVTLGEVLGDYAGKISERECVEVLKLMGEESNLMGCLYLYEWMGLQEPSLVSPHACSELFPVLGNAGMGDKVMILFVNLPKKKRFMDVHVYNAAMSGLLHGNRYDDAWKVFNDMETNNIQPDHVTCSIIITMMRKSGQTAKDAWEFFEKMNRKGVDWSLEVLSSLIKSFCHEGLVKEALIIQSQMEKKGIPSNAIVYNTLMDAYSKSNYVEEAEGLFTEMKARGLAPTSASYNTLMHAYSKRMQPEIVENLLEEMKTAGLEPNAKSYTCLISAYGRQRKKSDLAANAFLQMKKEGIKPTSHSYTALVHAYSVDGWHEKAYHAFETMRKEGIKPSVETYTTLIDAFRRAGDTDTLMEIWKMMMREKIEGTKVTFNMLLDGFCKQGHYIEARDVISEFGKIGFQPTVMTYNMLMNAYARGGQHQKLPQLLKEMAALYLKPDSITYSTMIYAYIRVRDFKRAFFYHKQMVKTKQLPDVKSYQKLRELLEVKAKIKNRKDKSAILGIVNSKMGIPQKKGKKDEFWKNRKSRALRD